MPLTVLPHLLGTSELTCAHLTWKLQALDPKLGTPAALSQHSWHLSLLSDGTQTLSWTKDDLN